MTAEREHHAGRAAGGAGPQPDQQPETVPSVASLSGGQLLGLACARCGRALPPTWRAARLFGHAEDRYGYRFALYGCAPACPPLPRRRPYAAWPPGGPPAAGPTAPG